MIYSIYAKFNLEKMSTAAARLVNDLNETMQGFGFSEELHLESTICIGQLTVSRALTNTEVQGIIRLALETLVKNGLPVISVDVE